MTDKDLRRKQAALNKARAKTMEKNVARILKGNRVPMSGSGAIKGDCIVPLDKYRSIYVECKLTAQEQLSLQTAWLSKAIAEARAMRCVFPILVYKFHRSHFYYVLVPEMASGFITMPDAIMHDHDFTGVKAIKISPVWAAQEKKIQTDSGIWQNMPIELFSGALESHALD